MLKMPVSQNEGNLLGALHHSRWATLSESVSPEPEECMVNWIRRTPHLVHKSYSICICWVGKHMLSNNTNSWINARSNCIFRWEVFLQDGSLPFHGLPRYQAHPLSYPTVCDAPLLNGELLDGWNWSLVTITPVLTQYLLHRKRSINNRMNEWHYLREYWLNPNVRLEFHTEE